MKAAVKVPELWDNQPIPSWEGRPGNMFGMMDAVTDGICQAGVVAESTFIYGLQQRGATACDFAFVGSSVVEPVPISIPMSVFFEPFISSLVVQYATLLPAMHRSPAHV